MPISTVDISTLVTRTPGLHGGKPHIAGKGVMVRTIAACYKKGLNAEEIAFHFGHITLAEVYASLAYYHANTEEIEDDIATQSAVAKSLELHYEDIDE